jgi:hypothetical protein
MAAIEQRGAKQPTAAGWFMPAAARRHAARAAGVSQRYGAAGASARHGALRIAAARGINIAAARVAIAAAAALPQPPDAGRGKCCVAIRSMAQSVENRASCRWHETRQPHAAAV